MRLLLDTHIALWVFAGDPRINSIRDTLLAKDTEVFVSVASLWEITIKASLGKLVADLKEIRWAIVASGFSELPVKGGHTEALLKLPPYHKDPFDRLLVAQANSEPMKLITCDSVLKQYSDLVWLI